MKSVFVALTIGLLMPSAVIAQGELETTWRRGDRAPVIVSCQTPDAAIRVAKGIEAEDDRAFIDQIASGLCTTAPMHPTLGAMAYALGRLDKWVAGPFEWRKSGKVSVWEFMWLHDEPRWLILPDSTGPHRPIPGA